MSEERVRPAPAQRFATDCLTFNLHSEIAALRAEPTPARHGHRQKTLFKHATRTLALFVLDAGATLPEHAAGGTMTVLVLEGEVDMMVAGTPHHLRSGDLLVTPPGVRHDVRTSGPAAFLLQVSLEAPRSES